MHLHYKLKFSWNKKITLYKQFEIKVERNNYGILRIIIKKLTLSKQFEIKIERNNYGIFRVLILL